MTAIAEPEKSQAWTGKKCWPKRDFSHLARQGADVNRKTKSQIKKASGDAEADIRLDKYGVFSYQF